jgi:hypothetical protein
VKLQFGKTYVPSASHNQAKWDKLASVMRSTKYPTVDHLIANGVPRAFILYCIRREWLRVEGNG